MGNNNLQFPFPYSRFIGFDDLFKEIERFAGSTGSNFPFYNLVRSSENELRIELALAGYTRDEITLEVQDNLLKIKGTPVKDDTEYLHHGISKKAFVETFRLDKNVVVDGADFVDGLLMIRLKVVVPDEQKPRLIEIK